MAAARHLSIRGRVQGVFYRAWAVATARELGLLGWVRNRTDGTVEAFVQGDVDAIERFIALAKVGPRSASVDRVDASDAEPDRNIVAFTQQRTT